MFTGIVQAIGEIAEVEPTGEDCRLRLDAGTLDMESVAVGDSIAVGGVCLTVTEKTANGFWTDVSKETLTRTALGRLGTGSKVNLEMSVTPSTRLGGHVVSGHVDGVGRLAAKTDDGRSVRIAIDAPVSLARYIAEKGSICMDGISLTVNDVQGARFWVNIVPHTQEATTMHALEVGDELNLEVDLIARYLERLLDARTVD